MKIAQGKFQEMVLRRNDKTRMLPHSKCYFTVQCLANWVWPMPTPAPDLCINCGLFYTLVVCILW